VESEGLGTNMGVRKDIETKDGEGHLPLAASFVSSSNI
jgi:hypothetical protein